MLNKYLEDNYNKIKDIAYNITGGRSCDDLFSFVIEELYKCDEERIIDIINEKKMTFYVVRVMINQYHSKTSRYYYKYNKYYEYHTTATIEHLSEDTYETVIEEKEAIEEKLEWVEEKLQDVYWFDAQVFRIYYLSEEKFSLNSMQEATKINRNTLHKSITNVKNYLKSEL